MSAKEESDLPEVAEKRAKKAALAAAELVEGRDGAKENAELQSTVRTQSLEAVSQAQARIREAQQEQTGQADGLASPHHRCSASKLLWFEEVCRAGCRRDDLDRIRGRARGEPLGPPLSRPNGSVSSATIAPNLYPKGRWQTAAARDRCTGR